MMTKTSRHQHTSARQSARTFVAAIETAAQFICFPLGETPAGHHSVSR